MLRTALLASALAFSLAVPAWAEVIHFKATMTPGQEVPPTKSHGSGAAEAQLDTATKTLSYKVSWKGLSGPATAAHFHGPAAKGENAPALVSLGDNPTSPASGKTQLTDDQVKAFMDGKAYVNVHTAANPGGEIRGQVTRGK